MISYTSRRTGEVFMFEDGNSYFSSSGSDGLRSWKWDSSTLCGRSSYTRPATEEKATVAFLDADDAEKFFALADADTEAGVYGRLSITDWEWRCNLVAGAFSTLSSDGSLAVYELTFRADSPLWTRQAGTWSFDAVAYGSDTTGLDYPHDYPFDLSPPISGQQTLSVESLAACEFELVFFGPVENPSVKIGDNRYRVACSVPAGALLFVDSVNQRNGDISVFLRSRDGVITNEYDKRIRGLEESGTYMFQRIESGESLVTWDGSFGFDLILYETRGVRPWN